MHVVLSKLMQWANERTQPLFNSVRLEIIKWPNLRDWRSFDRSSTGECSRTLCSIDLLANCIELLAVRWLFAAAIMRVKDAFYLMNKRGFSSLSSARKIMTHISRPPPDEWLTNALCSPLLLQVRTEWPFKDDCWPIELVSWVETAKGDIDRLRLVSCYLG